MMRMHVEIPEEIAQWLKEKAKATGSQPETVAVEKLRRQVEADDSCHDLMAPIHKAFRSSGLTEEEAVELFEEEKHAHWRERLQAKSSR